MTYLRDVCDSDGDTIDLLYFCSGGCWRDSFEPDRIGPANREATEGGSAPGQSNDAEGETHCAECGVLIKSDWRDTPTVVNLIERPPINAITNKAEAVNPLPNPELEQADAVNYLGEWSHEGGTLSEPITFRVHLWWDGRTKEDDRPITAYVLLANTEIVFSGEDFYPSVFQSPDSDAVVGCLVGFLGCKPGDVDEEFFEKYSERQLEFARAHGEELSMWSMELEGLDEGGEQ